MTRPTAPAIFHRPSSSFPTIDPHSYANLEKFRVFHIDIDWWVDFESKSISGSVKLLIKHVPEEASEYASKLCLDAKKLVVSSIVDSEGTQLLFKEEPRQFGGCLQIELSQACAKTPSFSLLIRYTTGSGEAASGLQWLKAAQTADKKAPFMYSQCQAIHARTLLPCQDSPSVKQTIGASVRTSLPALSVFMGAIPVVVVEGEKEQQEKLQTLDSHRTFRFHQPIPIPSYLIAICCGSLQQRSLSERCFVCAEASSLDKAAAEFEAIECFVQAAETLLGLPYQWTRYTCLVLPPSFPYGGMENPCLTFVTPTLLAGDKSLISVVIHEIVHSWTGNLLTNCTWEHFWLNEGFTKFIERKIIGAVFGDKFRHLASALGYSLLKEAVSFLGSSAETTKLVPNMAGIDPDEAFSRIPYEKGCLLLFYLEKVVGGAAHFDPFLRAYVAEFGAAVSSGSDQGCAKSILQTRDFQAFFTWYFEQKQPQLDQSHIDWHSWLHSPGLPAFVPTFDDAGAQQECSDLAQRWLLFSAAPESLQEEAWPQLFFALHPMQKVLFLEELVQQSPPLSHSTLATIDKQYKCFDRATATSSYNVEIQLKWIMLGIASKYFPIVEHATRFLACVGRMQYIRPIYRALYKWLPQLAWDSLYANEAFYHPIAKRVVMNELSISAPASEADA